MTLATTHVHLSKSSWRSFDTCRLAYRFERIDRLESDGARTALLRGSAAHELTATLIGAGVDPESAEADELVGEVLTGFALGSEDLDRVQGWEREAVGFLRTRGGVTRWVEELLAMDRIPNVTVWAKFDVAVLGGKVAPIEVVDWTFGSASVSDETQLAQSVGARLYRLVADTPSATSPFGQAQSPRFTFRR